MKCITNALKSAYSDLSDQANVNDLKFRTNNWKSKYFAKNCAIENGKFGSLDENLRTRNSVVEMDWKWELNGQSSR